MKLNDDSNPLERTFDKSGNNYLPTYIERRLYDIFNEENFYLISEYRPDLIITEETENDFYDILADVYDACSREDFESLEENEGKEYDSDLDTFSGWTMPNTIKRALEEGILIGEEFTQFNRENKLNILLDNF